MTRLMLAWVNWSICVASSVLKRQQKTGSPSSDAGPLKATQSSRKFDIAILLIVTSGILRSTVVTGDPSLPTLVIRMWTAFPV